MGGSDVVHSCTVDALLGHACLGGHHGAAFEVALEGCTDCFLLGVREIFLHIEPSLMSSGQKIQKASPANLEAPRT